MKNEILEKRINTLQFYTQFFSVCCVLLIIGLLYSSNIFAPNTGILQKSEINVHSFSELKLIADSTISLGDITIIQKDNQSNMKGSLFGLVPGESHELVILENSNFLEEPQENDKIFFFNPQNSLKHSCSRNNEESLVGYMGQITADQKGMAQFEMIKNNLNINMVFGRPIAILNKRECNDEELFISKKDIMAVGILSIYSKNSFEQNLTQVIKSKQVDSNLQQVIEKPDERDYLIPNLEPQLEDDKLFGMNNDTLNDDIYEIKEKDDETDSKNVKKHKKNEQKMNNVEKNIKTKLEDDDDKHANDDIKIIDDEKMEYEKNKLDEIKIYDDESQIKDDDSKIKDDISNDKEKKDEQNKNSWDDPWQVSSKNPWKETKKQQLQETKNLPWEETKSLPWEDIQKQPWEETPKKVWEDTPKKPQEDTLKKPWDDTLNKSQENTPLSQNNAKKPQEKKKATWESSAWKIDEPQTQIFNSNNSELLDFSDEKKDITTDSLSQEQLEQEKNMETVISDSPTSLSKDVKIFPQFKSFQSVKNKIPSENISFPSQLIENPFRMMGLFGQHKKKKQLPTIFESGIFKDHEIDDSSQRSLFDTFTNNKKSDLHEKFILDQKQKKEQADQAFQEKMSQINQKKLDDQNQKKIQSEMIMKQLDEKHKDMEQKKLIEEQEVIINSQKLLYNLQQY